MAVNSQSFGTIVSKAVAAVQGVASALVDFTQGSISLALIRAAAGIALWLQGILLQVAALTRFATSTGPDADTWGADFSFDRLLGVPSQGTVVFFRFTPISQATIQAATQTGTTSTGLPIWSGGAVAQTADGTVEFQVIPDSTQVAYNATLNAYVIITGVSSCNATVQCLTPGTVGNVAGDLINTLGQSILGVDTVDNPGAFTNGKDAESDTAYKARFPAYLQSLEGATPSAVITAVEDLQEGASCFLVENYSQSGVFQSNYFYCIVDDGTGSPSSQFLSSAYAAIDKVRAVGTEFGVFAPTVTTASVVMAVVVTDAFTPSVVAAQVATAITAYINSLPTNATLFYEQLVGVAFGVLGVANVPLSGYTLNGGTADVTPASGGLVKAGTVSVTGSAL